MILNWINNEWDYSKLWLKSEHKERQTSAEKELNSFQSLASSLPRDVRSGTV